MEWATVGGHRGTLELLRATGQRPPGPRETGSRVRGRVDMCFQVTGRSAEFWGLTEHAAWLVPLWEDALGARSTA